MSNGKKVAAIDIGTNSVLLLIAQLDNTDAVTALEEAAEITRLGEGLAASDRITPAAVERTVEVLRRYADRCRAHGVTRVVAVGTEALRQAQNRGEVLRQIKVRTGLEVEVIAAKREARLTYLAAEMDFGADLLVIDIGGGSTEFVTKESAISTSLGSVVLTERFLPSDPVNDDEYDALNRHIDVAFTRERTNVRTHERTKLIATAGTATTVAAMHLKLESYDQAKVHGAILSRGDCAAIIELVKPLSIDERRKLPGLHPQRAPFILAGAILLERAMNFLEFDRVTVSDRGLRWGVVYGLTSPLFESTNGLL